MLLTVISPTADILGNPEQPRTISKQDSQLLYGEQFLVEESHGAYVYGHSTTDSYKGYIEREQLIKDAPASTHFVQIRATHLYPEPSFKSRPFMPLSFLSRLTSTEKTENNFTQLDDGNWVFSDHIAPIENFKMKNDLADTANMFIGTPYLYGGRSEVGIDCSGLVQLCIYAGGYDCPPRDACDQEDSFGKPVTRNLQRNDVVYFKGHVGIMVDEKNIINATARHMTTLIEPLIDLEKAYKGITHIARL
jgi:cell wall-associated NlpC family hydrolase